MIIVLIGYMGSGKTTIGKQLSNLLSMKFLDLDSLVEKQEQCSVKALFEKKGELYFRKKEAEILRETINQDEHIVLSLGGGTPCYSQNMEFLNSQKHVLTVYLQTDIKTLAQRLQSEKDQRPLIAHLDTLDAITEFIAKHLFERKMFYQTAKVKINTSGCSVAEITEKITVQLF